MAKNNKIDVEDFEAEEGGLTQEQLEEVLAAGELINRGRSEDS